MNNCLGHDLELGLCWSSKAELSLSKQITGWSDMCRLSSRLYQLGLCLSDCCLLVLVFRFIFFPILPYEIAIFLYWDNEVFFIGLIFQNHELCMHFGMASF